MRALLVDDEPVARRVMREELEAFPDVQVVGEAENGQAALELIGTAAPDVVFLDLQMPVMNGFETVTRLRGPALPAIIILTAYDEFAIRAFEAGAVDYLLKPVSHARLKQTVERLRRLIKDPKQVVESLAQMQDAAGAHDAAGANVGMGRHQKVVGKHGDEYYLLDLDEVLAFQADGDLTWILTAKRKYLATQNLKTVQEKLASSQFRRIHRNAIINVNQIQKMSMLSSQRWQLTLTNGMQVTVSKRQAKNVRTVLDW